MPISGGDEVWPPPVLPALPLEPAVPALDSQVAAQPAETAPLMPDVVFAGVNHASGKPAMASMMSDELAVVLIGGSLERARHYYLRQWYDVEMS